MSASKNHSPEHPKQIRVGMQHPTVVYVHKPDYYAVHHRPRGEPAPGAVLVLDEGAIAVFRGKPGDAHTAASGVSGPASTADTTGTIGPVYVLQPGGPFAVPTGSVFVRFADGVAVESRRGDIQRAGYDVVEILPYAPNAAWLRARTDDIADALAGTPALEVLPDVENVEPQMLMESTRRQ